MAIDIKKIGEFGVSISKELDQTWFFMKKFDYGYEATLYVLVEGVGDKDKDYINTTKTISYEQGENILRQAFENANLEQWKKRYDEGDEGPAVELNWTIDVDDLEGNDIMMFSGNWKFPPNGWMMEVVKAVRAEEPDFGMCFKDLQ